ncbi:hypothetical protein [Butyrivibrio sp.]|uniref:hypothetical protein n=1 Tax=Butyrivibrio sp. TaxID=28121 RepID=UPI0025C54334|nr:hypothetical protein [Butyrivibrio sp.]MBQ7428360.1 hypothetical protein [Butyrivibrio sp.]MBQ9303664.1 hypothetical protein [Butyrivibrio sp.]
MGTMIDNAIHDTEVMKEYLEYRDEPRSWGLGVLIDIAHKYQKIQEIAEPLKGLSADEMSYVELRIREILDGNDNN